MRAIGIVLAGGNSSRMGILANKRAVAAMPIAGSYRSIDFALSNMSNSHVQKVAVCVECDGTCAPYRNLEAVRTGRVGS